MIWGIREARRVFTAKPLAEMVDEELSPGKALQSDDDLKQYILCGPAPDNGKPACNLDARVVNHQAGTCKMQYGPDTLRASLIASCVCSVCRGCVWSTPPSSLRCLRVHFSHGACGWRASS